MSSSSSPSRRLWRLPDRLIEFAGTPLLVGILNCTPDSFSDGGDHLDPGRAIARARALQEAGAALLDIGGESTRPGAEPVSAEEELQRVLPVIEAVSAEMSDVIVSLDTRKAAVAEAGLAAGARVINDISTLADPGMATVVAAHGAGLVLSHLRGEPATMQNKIDFENPVAEVAAELAAAAELAVAAGIDPEQIVLDPGIGFGKRLEQNLALLRHPDTLRWRDRPLLVGISRKRMLGELTGVADAAARDLATAVGSALLAGRGIELLRVHNVEGSRQALALAAAFSSR